MRVYAVGTAVGTIIHMLLLLAPAFALQQKSVDLINAACRTADKATVCTCYEKLRPQLLSFGSYAKCLPLPSDTHLTVGDTFERVTGLSSSAFAPKPRPPQRGLSLAPLEAASGLLVGNLLTFSGVLSEQEIPLRLSVLRSLESYELIALVLSILLGVTTVLAILDKVVLEERLLEALALLVVPTRRDAVATHEAGHFLCAYLLAVPVQACLLNPARSAFDPKLAGRVGTVFLSPAVEALRAGRPAAYDDVEIAAIVLMGGIAAEALTTGSAEGGAADERALAALLNSQETGLPQAEIRGRARWAAASALLLLKEQPSALAALRVALRQGRSVGECIAAIESAGR